MWTRLTWAVSRDLGKIPCSNDQFMKTLSRVDKILTLSLRIVTAILNGPEAFTLLKWDISLYTSSSVVGLNRNKFNEQFLTRFLNGLLESEVVFDRLGPMSTKELLKAVAISVVFVMPLPFTLRMFGRIPFPY